MSEEELAELLDPDPGPFDPACPVTVEIAGRKKGQMDSFRLTPAVPTVGDWCVVVRRAGGDTHRVEWGPFGVWHCDCTAHEFGKQCRHVRAAKQVLALARI